jgi:UDP-glucose 4-epimerase
MRIAVFGGSGRIGQALLPVLARGGHRLRGLHHKTALPAGIELVEGAITDPSAVAATIADAEVVLQMTKGGADVDQVAQTSVRGTVNIMDAILRAPSVRQYLLTSSDAAAGIWAHPHDRPISHATPPASYPGYYSLGKVLEEVIVAEYHRNHRLPYTIARLSWVQQEDSALRAFVANLDSRQTGQGPFREHYDQRQKEMLAGGKQFIVLPCDTAGKPLGRTLVQRQDVVAALAAMIDRPAALGRTFHISGPGFGYGRPCEFLAKRLGLPMERVMVPNAYPFTIDYSLTTQLLGWSPKYDVIAMLEAALAWASDHGG